MENRNLFGWVPDPPMMHKPKYKSIFSKAKSDEITTLPYSIDLRTNYDSIPIYDQGSLGSCTSNAVAFAYRCAELKQQLKHPFSPARLFMYYNARVGMGTVNKDSGASISGTFGSVANIGVCSETLLPYNIMKYQDKPSDECYTQASLCKTTDYLSVDQDMNSIKSALSEGYPIVFGIVLYNNFNSIGFNGMFRMPTEYSTVSGRHAICAVGYDDNIDFGDGIKGGLIIRNSWGYFWGNKGHFYLPYQYAVDTKKANSFWIIRKVMSSNIIEPDVNCCTTCLTNNFVNHRCVIV
jgi:C1A family cysteine protease